DAIELAADLFAFRAFSARTKVAKQSGRPLPRLPEFSSEIMRSCARRIRMILASLSESVTGEDQDRLRALLRAIDEGRIDLESLDVGGVFSFVMSMHPDDAANWLRANLGTIEARLAS
ncbi:MAG: hypothetical protein ABI678_02165, partial [Kofleriaceae bacterium]